MKRMTRIGLLLSLAMLGSTASAQSPTCVNTARPVTKVDMQRVHKAWLGWNNRLRRRMKLRPYAHNDALNVSAGNWSLYAMQRGMIDHKRAPDAAYYDYEGIQEWFRGLGLEFANVNRTTFTENIGWGYYSCSKSDCTSALTAAIRSTFRFYLAERNKEYKPHWNSIMNGNFRQIGLGIAVDEAQGMYYLTIHYATEITSEPLPPCAGT